MLRLLLLALVFCLSCAVAPGQPRSPRPDSFTAVQLVTGDHDALVAADEAISALWFDSNGVVELRLAKPGEPGPIRIRCLSSGDPLVASVEAQLGFRVLGFTFRDGREADVYLVSDRIQPDRERPIMMHELLHALGVKHTERGPAIMNQTSSEVDRLTHWDLLVLCEAVDCTLTKVRVEQPVWSEDGWK
jgi:hypothetical protein